MSEPDNKPKKIENDQEQQSKIDLMYHLLNNGIIAYLPPGFDVENFTEKLLDLMQQKFQVEALYFKGINIHQIDYKKKGGIVKSLGIGTGFKLFFILDKGRIYFDIKEDKWFENPDIKFSINKLISESHQHEIETFIFDYLHKNSPGVQKELKVDSRNHYIEKLSKQKKIWYANHSGDDELLLAFLGFSTIKTNDGSLNNDNEISWHLIITTQRTQFVGFDKREELIQAIDCADEEISVKKEIGRNPISYKNIVFFSTHANDQLLYHVQHINLQKPDDKIREIARLNWTYKKKNEVSNRFAIALVKKLIKEQDNPFDELSLFFMEYTEGNREKVFSAFSEEDKLLDLLHQILNYAGTNEYLTHWIERWEISYIDSVAINELLYKAIEDAVQANNILPFHRLVRDIFLKKNDDKLNPILFDITFSQHLMKCGLIKEAKKILEKRLKELPDESISDLLPAKDLDLTGSGAGQIIKINILELLAEIETEKDAIGHKSRMAQLQPLVEDRIESLLDVSDSLISSKAKEIKQLMEPESLMTLANKANKVKYQPLEAKLLEKHVRHPATHKGHDFSNFQKWLATVKIPDTSVLRSYSEKLSPQNHKELSEIITDIKYALNIEKLEVYISRGEKSVGINGFEGDPSFLIIGGEHLEKNSAHFLDSMEMRFAIGVELAHLHFKHARITSSDVWKGAVEKGYFMLDTILSIVPAVGLFGKSLQGLTKLHSISTFLQRAGKFGKASTQSKELLNTSEQVVNIYKTKFKKDKKESDKEKEFLATSRIIQLTADRCALLFTKDLVAAIRAMFLVSKTYYTELPMVEKYGLKEFLLKKEEDGSYRHQEFAIRLANLFSFYLSDDYDATLKSLEV